MLYIIIISFISITGVISIEDKFKVHIYRDSNLIKDDCQFELECKLSYNHIHITDWSYFDDALDNSNIATDYYPIVFCKHYPENNMFGIGRVV